MNGSYLGSKFSNTQIVDFLNKIDANFQELEDEKLFVKLLSF